MPSATKPKTTLKDLDALRPHLGLNADRLPHDRIGLEFAFAREWAKACHGNRDINGGVGVLDGICSHEIPSSGVERVLAAAIGQHPRQHLVPLDDTHRAVAATVIQWLGTNIGRSFLHEAYRSAGFKLIIERIEPETNSEQAGAPEVSSP